MMLSMKEWFVDKEWLQFVIWLGDWQVLLIPFAVMIISQIIKVTLESKQKGKFEWAHLNSYGGMPSSHTAMFVSASLIMGLTEGFSSSVFAVTLFLTAVLVRDAIGIRWALGFHGKILNHLIRTLPENERKHFPKQLQERLGHTPKEALAGGTLGALLTILFYFLIN